MSWQKCPICNGDGQVNNNFSTSSIYKICPLCDGKRIISELTGLPPNVIGIPVKISDEQKASEIADIMKRTEEQCKK